MCLCPTDSGCINQRCGIDKLEIRFQILYFFPFFTFRLRLTHPWYTTPLKLASRSMTYESYINGTFLPTTTPFKLASKSTTYESYINGASLPTMTPLSYCSQLHDSDSYINGVFLPTTALLKIASSSTSPTQHCHLGSH